MPCVRIVREIGRGGMGVVYEAEQISLDRKVALKVLPFAAVLDPKQLQRFKNEAHAAAGLHHTNIVPVYLVGCERAVHFYAMQYVDGQTLAQVIRQLRLLEGLDDKVPEHAGQAGFNLADSLASGRFDPHLPLTTDQNQADSPLLPPPSALPLPPCDGLPGVERSESPEADTKGQPQAAISTQHSTKSLAYFRSVANLGVQAAEALEHAHGMGVVHRDIKPSNLMVDVAGHLWITDFGLAMTQTDTNLTLTGDILGTLRYMSPEQAAGKSRVLDHHTDVYSLGVTLYELLTLRPAFRGDNRQKLLRQVAEDEPRGPRQWNRAIPADLETIVLKAIAKEPQARYATAQELAEDLVRFLQDEPIQARRPSLAARTLKWSRRHRAVVWLAAAGLMIATAVAAAIVWDGYQSEVELERAVERSLAATRAFLESGDYAAADRKLVQAQTRLDVAQFREGPLQAAVARVSEEVLAKTRALERFERFRELRQRVHADMYHIDDRVQQQAQENCRAALKLYRVFKTGPWKQRPEFRDLDWEHQTRLQEPVAELLYVLARLEVRPRGDPAGTNTGAHRRAIDALQQIETFHRPIPAVYLWMAQSWRALGQQQLAEDAQQRADSLHSTTCLDYFVLAEFYAHHRRLDQALENYSLALRRKPDHYLSLLALGVTLVDLGRHELAEAMLTGAIAVNQRTILAYVKRAESCLEQGKLELAQTDLAMAAELDPRLGQAGRKDLRKTIAEYYDGTLYARTSGYHRPSNSSDEEMSRLTEAIRTNPNDASAYNERGRAYEVDWSTGKVQWLFDYDPQVGDVYGYNSWPALDPDQGLLFLSEVGVVHQYDAATGTPTGVDYRLVGDELASALQVSGGRLYAHRKHGLDVFDIQTSPGNYTAKWTAANFPDSFGDFDHVAISESTGLLYYHVDPEFAFVALDAATGEEIWRYHDSGSFLASPTVVEDPSIGGPTVYCRDMSNHDVVALWAGRDLPDGETRLRWRQGGYVDAVYHFAYHAASTTLLFSDGTEVYGVDALTGVGKWSFPTVGELWSSPAVSGDVAYVGTTDMEAYDGWLYALNAETGELLWKFHSGYPIMETPCIGAGGVFVDRYIGGFENTILGFFPPSWPGPEVPWPGAINVLADPVQIGTNGDTSLVTAQLMDAYGNPLEAEGLPVEFSVSPDKPNVGSVGPAVAYTNSSGIAGTLFTSSKREGVITVTATTDQPSVSGSIQITIVKGGGDEPPQTGAIQGIVFHGNKRVNDATVTVTNSDTPNSWETTSNKAGRYKIADLPVGTYVVYGYKDNVGSDTVSGVPVVAGETTPVDLDLQ